MKKITNALCYLSADEVNIARALELAAARGIDLEMFFEARTRGVLRMGKRMVVERNRPG